MPNLQHTPPHAAASTSPNRMITRNEGRHTSIADNERLAELRLPKTRVLRHRPGPQQQPATQSTLAAAAGSVLTAAGSALGAVVSILSPSREADGDATNNTGRQEEQEHEHEHDNETNLSHIFTDTTDQDEADAALTMQAGVGGGEGGGGDSHATGGGRPSRDMASSGDQNEMLGALLQAFQQLQSDVAALQAARVPEANPASTTGSMPQHRSASSLHQQLGMPPLGAPGGSFPFGAPLPPGTLPSFLGGDLGATALALSGTTAGKQAKTILLENHLHFLNRGTPTFLGRPTPLHYTYHDLEVNKRVWQRVAPLSISIHTGDLEHQFTPPPLGFPMGRSSAKAWASGDFGATLRVIHVVPSFGPEQTEKPAREKVDAKVVDGTTFVVHELNSDLPVLREYPFVDVVDVLRRLELLLGGFLTFYPGSRAFAPPGIKPSRLAHPFSMAGVIESFLSVVAWRVRQDGRGTATEALAVAKVVDDSMVQIMDHFTTMASTYQPRHRTLSVEEWRDVDAGVRQVLEPALRSLQSLTITNSPLKATSITTTNKVNITSALHIGGRQNDLCQAYLVHGECTDADCTLLHMKPGKKGGFDITPKESKAVISTLLQTLHKAGVIPPVPRS